MYADRTVENDIAVAQEPAGEIRRDEGQDPGSGGLDDEFAEPVKGQRARPALVDHRGDPAADPDEIGVEPEIARNVLVDMGVSIDQPRGNQQPACVDDSGRGTVFKGRRDGSDAALLDADIEDAVEIVGRVDDMPALDHRI